MTHKDIIQAEKYTEFFLWYTSWHDVPHDYRDLAKLKDCADRMFYSKLYQMVVGHEL